MAFAQDDYTAAPDNAFRIDGRFGPTNKKPNLLLCRITRPDDINGIKA